MQVIDRKNILVIDNTKKKKMDQSQRHKKWKSSIKKCNQNIQVIKPKNCSYRQKKNASYRSKKASHQHKKNLSQPTKKKKKITQLTSLKKIYKLFNLKTMHVIETRNGSIHKSSAKRRQM